MMEEEQDEEEERLSVHVRDSHAALTANKTQMRIILSCRREYKQVKTQMPVISTPALTRQHPNAVNSHAGID